MKTIAPFEVVVPLTAWRPAVMPLLGRPELVATGSIVRDLSRQPTGLLADDLLVSATPRTGRDFPPLADWLAVAAPRGEPPAEPDEWIRRLEPRFAQMLVVLLIGFGPNRGDWRGWTIERGEVRPLAGFRIVGPGMVRVGSDPSSSEDAAADRQRWSRVAGALGEATFAKVRTAAIALVGCSRTGTPAASMFAALGVRCLTLIDGDTIEMHNLDGMLLATEADIGSNKALAVGQRLVEFRSDLMVKAIARPLARHQANSQLGGADLVVTCVDADRARLIASHWAAEHLVPHLDIGTGVTRTANGELLLAADVRLLVPGPGGGCIRCVGGLRDPDADYDFHAPPGALPRRPPDDWNAHGRLGSLVSLNFLAASFAVQAWLDLLAGSLAGSVWHRLRWQVGQGLEVESGLVGASEGCEFCGAMKKN